SSSRRSRSNVVVASAFMIASRAFAQQFAQPSQAAPQQAAGRRLAAPQRRGYLLDGQPVQVVQLDGAALVLRQLRQRRRQPPQLLVPHRPLVRRRLVRGQERLQSRRRVLDRGVQRPLAERVALAGGEEAAHGGGELTGEDLPQPGGALGLGGAAE